MNNPKTRFISPLLLFLTLALYSQKPLNLWSKNDQYFTKISPHHRSKLNDGHLTFYNLKRSVLEKKLKGLNQEDKIEMLFPNSKGDLIAFSVKESSMFALGLAKKYPQIKTYKGVGIDDPLTTIRFSLSQIGLHALLHDNNSQAYYIEPENNETEVYKIFDREYHGKNKIGLDCLTESTSNSDTNESSSKHSNRSVSNNVNLFEDSKLRTFRLALSCTGEYANLFKGSGTEEQQKANVLAEMTKAINRVNEIYERDLGIRLVFVDNMDDVIYLDPSSDPWATEYNTKTAETLDDVIGVNNYDIGHNFNTSDGGSAGCIGCVCKQVSQSSSHKGRGYTGLPDPTGDPFYIDYVCHEMGHQFGAYHTMNKCDRGNQFTGSEVEPGSGSSIMGYAGICDPNVQFNSDAHFNYVNIKQIANYVINETGASCAEVIPIANHPPVANAGPDYTIPTNTPFVLTGSASDADGLNSLTYNWSQNDPNFPPGNTAPQSDWGEGALYRSLLPSSSPKRYFPELRHVVNGKIRTTWEVTPSVARTLNFAFIVRDNGSGLSGDDGVGQLDADLMKVTVVETGSPFDVTSQTERHSWDVGTLETVTWNVAGTNTNGINVSHVDILMSVNDGETFDISLAENVPNTGSYDITVPDLKGFGFKIMVKARDNIFYAINEGFVEIGYFVNRSCFTFENTTTYNIPDNTDNYAIESSVNVPSKTGKLVDVNITLDVNHSYIGDLEIALVNPEGTMVELMKRRDCTSQNNLKVVFDHEGEPFECSNTNNFSNYSSFKDPINTFYDKLAEGDWTLKIGDHGPGDVGILNNWSMELCFEEIELSNAFISTIDFELYPNPAKSKLFINVQSQFNDLLQIKLFDVNGRLIYNENKTSNSNNSIDVSSFVRGIYFLEVSQNNLTKVKRVILN